MSRILVVDDEDIMCRELTLLLNGRGHEVVVAGSVGEALAKHDLDAFDLVITDLRLGDGAGTDLIAHAGETRVVVITAYADVKSAVLAMRLRAADYIAKPFDQDELLLVVERELAAKQLSSRAAALAKDVGEVWPVGGMIGDSPPMRKVFDRIVKVAPTDANVLIRGESGTGKELVARAIHDRSRRRDGPLVALNCSAISEGLIDSELFGHEKGAFTHASTARIGLVEAANGGTLFLDEIGELPAPAQARLLRVIQERKVRRVGAAKERPVDVRFITATHRDLAKRVEEGCFRDDLYFRLRVFDILLPPLRERGGDVEELARHLLAQAGRRPGKGDLDFTPEALVAVRDHHWPGNVRELQNAIERAVILCDTGRITPELLGIEEPDDAAHAGPSIVAYVSTFILENQARLSDAEIVRRLGRSRKWLWETRKRLGIPRPERNPPRHRK